MTDTQVYKFMEHFGVKGMHWGVRKARSGKSESKEEKPKLTPYQERMKSQRRKDTALKVGFTVAVGGLVAAALIKQNQDKKVSEIRRVQSNLDANKRLFDAHKGVQITNLNKAFNAGKVTEKQGWKISDLATQQAKTQTKKSNDRFIEDFTKRQRELNRLANKDLKGWYERSQTPIKDRGYLSDW